jgi:hypothetical protein
MRRWIDAVGRVRPAVGAAVSVPAERVVDQEHLVERGSGQRGQELGQRHTGQPQRPPVVGEISAGAGEDRE